MEKCLRSVNRIYSAMAIFALLAGFVYSGCEGMNKNEITIGGDPAIYNKALGKLMNLAVEGNCTACHTAAQILNKPYGMTPVYAFADENSSVANQAFLAIYSSEFTGDSKLMRIVKHAEHFPSVAAARDDDTQAKWLEAETAYVADKNGTVVVTVDRCDADHLPKFVTWRESVTCESCHTPGRDSPNFVADDTTSCQNFRAFAAGATAEDSTIWKKNVTGSMSHGGGLMMTDSPSQDAFRAWIQ